MTKHKKILIACSPILAIAIFYLSAAIIRAVIVPQYISLFYTKSVDQVFDSNYAQIAEQLNLYNLSLKPSKATCYNHINDGGGNANFHFFRETVPCERSASSKIFIPSADYIANWKLNSSKLASHLQSNGWKQDYITVSNISQLLDPGSGATINYSKITGKVSCYLGINYSEYGSDPMNRMSSGMQCYRNVSIFGGY